MRGELSVTCSVCGRRVELAIIDGRVSLEPINGWRVLPVICPDCERAEAVAEVLMGGDNEKG